MTVDSRVRNGIQDRIRGIPSIRFRSVASAAREVKVVPPERVPWKTGNRSTMFDLVRPNSADRAFTVTAKVVVHFVQCLSHLWVVILRAHFANLVARAARESLEQFLRPSRAVSDDTQWLGRAHHVPQDERSAVSDL